MPIPENIYEEIDNIFEIPRSNRDDTQLAIDRVISHIQSLLLTSEYSSFSSERAELLYLLGYTYYLYPDRRDRNIYENIDKALLLAIEIKADYSIAWLYLGHNAYDLGRYNDAKERFSRCQENHFNSFYQLILLEMQLCCAIKIDGIAEMLDEVEDFVEKLEKHDPPEDVFPYVVLSILEKDSINLEGSARDLAIILLSRLRNS